MALILNVFTWLQMHATIVNLVYRVLYSALVWVLIVNIVTLALLQWGQGAPWPPHFCPILV